MYEGSDSPRSLLRDLLEYQFYIRLFSGILMLVLLFGFLIYSFIVGNRDVLVLGAAILFVVIFAVTTIVFTTRALKNTRLKRNYLKSTCYQLTQNPFKKEYRMPYYQFQFNLYDRLIEKVSGHILFDVILKEQDYDNNDISIDLLLLHQSGIYVIQALSYDGPLKGKLEDRIWTPHFYLGIKKELSVDHTLLKSWQKANIISNPIMQTDMYVKNLKKYLANYDIKGVTIFDDKMIEPNVSLDKRIYSFKQFVSYINEQPYQYSDHELDEIKQKLKSAIHSK